MIDIDPESMRQQLRNMRFHYHEIENYRLPWNGDDCLNLKELYCEGYGISEIAIRLGRSELATIKQIEKMEMHKKVYNTSEKKERGCYCRLCPYNNTTQCHKECINA